MQLVGAEHDNHDISNSIFDPEITWCVNFEPSLHQRKSPLAFVPSQSRHYLKIPSPFWSSHKHQYWTRTWASRPDLTWPPLTRRELQKGGVEGSYPLFRPTRRYGRYRHPCQCAGSCKGLTASYRNQIQGYGGRNCYVCVVTRHWDGGQGRWAGTYSEKSLFIPRPGTVHIREKKKKKKKKKRGAGKRFGQGEWFFRGTRKKGHIWVFIPMSPLGYDYDWLVCWNLELSLAHPLTHDQLSRY